MGLTKKERGIILIYWKNLANFDEMSSEVINAALTL